MGLSVVAVTEADRAQGALAQQSVMAAYKAMYDDGVVVLRGLFPAETIAALHDEFGDRYGNFDGAAMLAMAERPPPNPIQKNGDARFEVAMQMSGGFGRPGLFANPILMQLLSPILGRGIMRMASMTAVTSFPGAKAQHVHRDNPPLFEEHPHIGAALPHYAITAAIPLIDVDHVTGPTGFWLGSHRWQANLATPETMQSIPFQRGDCLLVDYRTVHAGMANGGNKVRPILYMVYCREWFYDDGNHRQRMPLNIALEDIKALPQELQLLMLRARQHAFQARQPTPA